MGIYQNAITVLWLSNEHYMQKGDYMGNRLVKDFIWKFEICNSVKANARVIILMKSNASYSNGVKH